MASKSAFTSAWTQDSPYWIVVPAEQGSALNGALQRAGMKPLGNNGLGAYLGVNTGADWAKAWSKIAAVLTASKTPDIKTALIANVDAPGVQEITFHLKPWQDVQDIADNLWLADAINNDGLVCFMQRVVDRRGKHVGYEAFARIQKSNGEIVGGGDIMKASRALKVEYQIDRLMQKLAIESYVQSDLDGVIFINFLTGFIQRPEVYLEGLSQAVEQYKLLPRMIALDVPVTDPRDVVKLKSIAEYCRNKGFGLALDDIMSPYGLVEVLNDLRPAFVKLDAKLGADMRDVKRAGNVMTIIRHAKAAGATVLAEGVEDEALYQLYVEAEVDMFQGYHFGKPEPMLAKKKRAAS